MKIKGFFNQSLPYAMLTICSGLCLLATEASIQAEQQKPAEQQTNSQPDPFCSLILERVHACVDYNADITNKEAIHALLANLEQTNCILQEGSDDLRTKFVPAQGCFEHVLSCSQILGEIEQLVGVIHTPFPATPLCTNLEDPLLGDVLDASIANDQDKLLTVRMRTQIVRDYLKNGGKLFVVYPKGGLEKRTAEQQQYYLDAVRSNPGYLFDMALNCSQMHPDMIGATYLFKSQNQWYAFSIKARQAIDPQANSEWGIWFGKISLPVIKSRLMTVQGYLLQNQGPDFRPLISK